MERFARIGPEVIWSANSLCINHGIINQTLQNIFNWHWSLKENKQFEMHLQDIVTFPVDLVLIDDNTQQVIQNR